MQLGEKIGFEYDLFQVEDEKFGAFDKVKNCCPPIQGFTLRNFSPRFGSETCIWLANHLMDGGLRLLDMYSKSNLRWSS